MQQIQENWRYFFYYTLGLLPSVFFTLRFLIQWINSEKKKKSYVNTTFWYLSFCGNTLCSIHYFIQLQYLLMLIQVANGFISWKNICLLKARKNKTSFTKSIVLLSVLMMLASMIFFSQFVFISAPIKILEIPFGLSKHGIGEISILWHLLGGFGCLLFASRFWIQWLEAEKTGESQLSNNFWLISIFGSAIALIYFLHIKDWVSSLNYSFGLIPYARNLILSYRGKNSLNPNR